MTPLIFATATATGVLVLGLYLAVWALVEAHITGRYLRERDAQLAMEEHYDGLRAFSSGRAPIFPPIGVVARARAMHGPAPTRWPLLVWPTREWPIVRGVS